MPRGDNLTNEDRTRGGRHSHSGSRSRSSGYKGGRSSSTRSNQRGLGSADQETREHVAQEGGES